MNSNIKPNLFIVGAPGCGTTTLYHYLRQHPNIFMSGYKEPHYFGKDLRKNKKLYFTNKGKYLDLFTKGLGKQAIGEASSYYLFSSSAPKEIFQFNPRAKIIILLRQPTELLYSYHSQLLYLGDECEKDFYKALNLENSRKKGKHLPDNYTIIERLFYRTLIYKLPDQINLYKRIFSQDKVSIHLLDDLSDDIDKTFRNILMFIGVDPTFRPEYSLMNTNKTFRSKVIRDSIFYLSPILGNLRNNISSKSWGIMKFIEKVNTRYLHRDLINPLIKKELDAEFKPTIIKLEEIINRDLSHWYH